MSTAERGVEPAAGAGVDAGDDVAISGACLAMFAFDIGFQIDLESAAGLAADASRPRTVRARRKAPSWFDFEPAPLSLAMEGARVEVGGLATDPTAELLVHDFGAAVVTYRLPLPATLAGLPALGTALFENADLVDDARQRVRRCMQAIGPAIEKARLGDAVEDYAVFAITRWSDPRPPEALLAEHRTVLAMTIEAELAPLAPRQEQWSTGSHLAYGPRDLAIIDWNAAILFDEAPDDVIAVLQHANVELLELRVLDLELDAILDHADESLARLGPGRLWPAFGAATLLQRFATVQTDAAVMFEGINNAIKLLGNQYLARLYRLAAERMDLPAWQRNVQRKLAATESVYQKMSDASSVRRLETLEWVIIVLIALSILLTFVGPH